MDIHYARLRESNRALKYRLQRRGFEVIRAIRKYGVSAESILDLGTAEGRMMHRIKAEFPKAFCVGIDLSRPLLQYARMKTVALGIHLIQADIQALEFIRDSSFAVITATAVIEHLEDPQKFLDQAIRLLKTQGIMVITTPHPLWDVLARHLHLVKGEHKSVMGLRELKQMCLAAGFSLVEERGFMISPIGFPGERSIEKILGFMGMTRGFPNQLIILRKPL